TTDLGPRTNDGTHKRRRLTFLGFTIYRARSLSQSVRKTVFQTEGKRFSRAKAGMKDLRRRMKHHPVEEPAGAINRILRGHFNYYGWRVMHGSSSRSGTSLSGNGNIRCRSAARREGSP